MRTNQLAFSLVELSIVLVILGLLVGGVLSGQSLIHAAEMRAVSTEYNRYVSATNSFRDKYFALPGDMTNATSFWGAGTCPGTSADTPTAQSNTCNGNGDGHVDRIAIVTNETTRYWQQLALAGLIEGRYTGVTSSGTYDSTNLSVSTPDVPRSKLSNGAWYFGWLGPVATDGADTNGVAYAGSYGNVFSFGAIAANSLNFAPIFKPEDAWNIDTKLDDGKPATGNIRSIYPQDGTGATSCGSRASGTYTLSATSVNCTLGFASGF